MDYISTWYSSPKRLDGETIIVTGGNTGMGKETAFDLYRRGARVIMACRNVIKAKEAKAEIEQWTGSNAGVLVVKELDLSSNKSIRAFAELIIQREANLYALVNNAGLMMCSESRTEDGFDMQLGTNHLGPALLTLLLLPLLIKSAPSRVVNVASDAHIFSNLNLEDVNFEKTPYGALKAYAASKVAVILFTRALSRRLKERNIKGVSTYAVHPGIVKTGIDRYFDENAWKIISYGFKNRLLGWCWKSARCGAQTTIYCTVDDSCAHESGGYYRECKRTCLMTRQCHNDGAMEKLWEITIEMLKLKDYNPFQIWG